MSIRIRISPPLIVCTLTAVVMSCVHTAHVSLDHVGAYGSVLTVGDTRGVLPNAKSPGFLERLTWEPSFEDAERFEQAFAVYVREHNESRPDCDGALSLREVQRSLFRQYIGVDRSGRRALEVHLIRADICRSAAADPSRARCEDEFLGMKDGGLHELVITFDSDGRFSSIDWLGGCA